jgi:DNA topoisomerase IB
MRERKEAARLRITEIFDKEEWFPIVKSATLYEHLQEEGLDDLLPSTFRGRVGVQPTGYPLTFYTYAGLELDSPPINEVTMNPNYGMEEPDKDYKIHPVTDGTFYCETKAVVGDSKTKHYTLEYKRRARRLKYDSVEKLGQVIDQVRARLFEHLQSDHRDTWVRALICLLIDKYCARIGNEASAKREENKTYGITTLRTGKHVFVKKDHIIIEYSGKHCQPQRHALPIYRTVAEHQEHPLEAMIAAKLIDLIQEKRRYLFTRSDRKPYTPQMVNDYFTASTEINTEGNLPYGGAGSPCTVHNMRNYHATRLFRQYSEKFLHRKPNPTYEDVLIAYQGRNKTIKYNGHPGVLAMIARMLGNTPAICRRSYIDPREQLLFFQRWGFRPPDCIIRDLFVQEDEDTYGLRRVIRWEQKRARELAKQNA